MASVYLGIDYGAKRVGLSHADGLGFAFPLPAAVGPDAEARFAQIGQEIARLRVTHLILGYPLLIGALAWWSAGEAGRSRSLHKDGIVVMLPQNVPVLNPYLPATEVERETRETVAVS